MNKLIYCHYGNNHHVIDYYMKIVLDSFGEKGYITESVEFKDARLLDKNNYIFVVTSFSLFKWYLKGFRKFIFWSQGTFPEESYMRNKSMLRKFVAGKIEKFALSKAKMCLFVSNYQMNYFSNIYNLELKPKSYIMPCYNCNLNMRSFECVDKYTNNIFCYVGSLATWQYFNETVAFYKEIEDKYNQKTFFKVYTPDVEHAKEIIRNARVKNYLVKYVDQSNLAEELKDCKFGFMLRENTVVNNVATPTKLSTYLSNGILPIVSDCIKDYEVFMNNQRFFILVDDDMRTSCVDYYIENSIDVNDVKKSFETFFNLHFNTKLHISNIVHLIEKLKF